MSLTGLRMFNRFLRKSKTVWASRRHPLKLKAKMALVREAGAKRDLGQAEFAVCPQEVLRLFDAARDHILVRRQPGGRLELPREVKGAEIDDGRHLLQL